MGFRFQRRIKVFPGLHLNLSRSDVGLSVGARGAHVGITARGQHTPASGYQARAFPGASISTRGRAGGRRNRARCASLAMFTFMAVVRWCALRAWWFWPCGCCLFRS
jgi:hypothetical protein